MPSAFTHAIAAASIGTVMVPGRRGLIAVGVGCAILPDADVLAFKLGIRYQDMLGHRGLSHSVLFAACLAAAGTWFMARSGRVRISTVRLGLFLFAAALSHGLLDALTDGGLGVAFLAPFSDERYFFPWRPIAVSPISLRRFFSGRGLAVVASEIAIVWIPALALWAIGVAFRRSRPQASAPPNIGDKG